LQQYGIDITTEKTFREIKELDKITKKLMQPEKFPKLTIPILPEFTKDIDSLKTSLIF